MDILKTSLNACGEFAVAFDSFKVDAEPDLSVLSKDESEICSKFRSLKRRCEYSIGRVICRKVLQELNIDIKGLSILNDASGAPFITGCEFIPTISHSRGKIVALVFEKSFSFGIDIERVNYGRVLALSKMSPGCENLREMTTLWTLKEALAKAVRTGIGERFDIYEVENFFSRLDLCKCNFKNFSEYCGITIHNGVWAISAVFKKEYRFDEDRLVDFMRKCIS